MLPNFHQLKKKFAKKISKKLVKSLSNNKLSMKLYKSVTNLWKKSAMDKDPRNVELYMSLLVLHDT